MKHVGTRPGCSRGIILFLVSFCTVAGAITISVGPLVRSVNKQLLGVNAGPLSLSGGGGVCPASTYNFAQEFKDIGVTSIRTHDMYGPMDMAVLWYDPAIPPGQPGQFNWDGSVAVPHTCAGSGTPVMANFNSKSLISTGVPIPIPPPLPREATVCFTKTPEPGLPKEHRQAMPSLYGIKFPGLIISARRSSIPPEMIYG